MIFGKLFDSSHELGRAMLSVRPALLRAAGFSFALNLLYLAPSIYMLQVYDRVLASRNLTTLLMLTLLIAVFYVLFGVLDRIRTQMLIRVGVKLDQVLADRVFAAGFERSLRRAGPGPAQALQDLTSVRQFAAGAGALAFFDTPWLPVYVLVIGLIHPWLAVFALVVVVLLFALTWLNEWRTHKPITEANKEAQATAQFVNNNLRHAEAVKALGMLGTMRKRWAEKQNKVLALQTFASEEGAKLGSLGKSARMLFQSLILGVGAWLAIQDLITPGGMIVGSILLGRALAPAELLIGAWKQWITASDAYRRLGELLATYPAPVPGLQLPVPKGAIAVEDVHAIPPGGKNPVLMGLSFTIHPADVVVVVGPSGCGKSTLARLLVGVWPTARGLVRLDGADVFTWDKDHLGPYVGYLPQDIALFEGTVAENIGRFGDLDSEAVVRAATLAGMHEMVLRLPQGYDTPVGADGGGLSGGQRQRIALARALYGTPKLLVLDEPNSNLDQAGEAALLNAVRAMKAQGTTVVMIAHGPNLLQVAEKMLVLRDGQMVVYGPRDKVLAHLQEQAQKAQAEAATKGAAGGSKPVQARLAAPTTTAATTATTEPADDPSVTL
ncbi:MAG: type I secretion system permease/ATPase [Burkholderiaceae bacterium]